MSQTMDETFRLHGVDLRYPTHFRDGHSLLGLFPVRADVADRHLAEHGLTAARIRPGKALLALAGVRYTDSDCGAYDELALSFFVTLPGSRRRLPLVGTWRALSAGRLPSFTWRLPVTTELSRDAGVQMWGFPKTVEDVEVDVLAGRATVTWRDRGRLVLRYSLEAEGDETLGPISPPVLTSIGGRTHVSHLTQRYRDMSRQRPGGELELGDHPVADELRELGVRPRAMVGVFNGHLSFEIGAPAPL